MSSLPQLNPKDLSELHLSALQEMGNVGMGHAATALSQLIDRRVELRVPTVSIVGLSEVPELLGGPERLVVGVFMRVWGDARGNVLLVFPNESAGILVAALMGESPPPSGELPDEMLSAFQEVGNILASSFLAAMGTLLGITLFPSVPAVARDMAGAIVDQVLVELGSASDVCVVIETQFEGVPEIMGHFFLLPDADSLDILLRAGGVI